jgi:hypothetical protein
VLQQLQELVDLQQMRVWPSVAIVPKAIAAAAIGDVPPTLHQHRVPTDPVRQTRHATRPCHTGTWRCWLQAHLLAAEGGTGVPMQASSAKVHGSCSCMTDLPAATPGREHPPSSVVPRLLMIERSSCKSDTLRASSTLLACHGM